MSTTSTPSTANPASTGTRVAIPSPTATPATQAPAEDKISDSDSDFEVWIEEKPVAPLANSWNEIEDKGLALAITTDFMKNKDSKIKVAAAFMGKYKSAKKQVFMSFFFKKSSKARDVEDGAQVEDISIEEGSAVAEEMENDDDVTADDDGHGVFNATVVCFVYDRAIEIMRKRRDSITVSRDELNSALQIMPCNSDHVCLKSHLYFRDVVEVMTHTNPELSRYYLNDDQWDLAEDLADAVELFEEPTKKFSQEGAPLIVDVLPSLYELKLSMAAIRDSNINPACNIMRIAAQAAILVIDKYTVFTEACKIESIRDMVIKQWEESYTPEVWEETEVVEEPDTKKNHFKRTIEPTIPSHPIDHILTYLAEKPIPMTDIKSAGGYVKWWHNAISTCKSVARMGVEYCGAPASSVTVEQAFSVGQQQIGFDQHNMSSNTFHAAMLDGDGD
ncbi:hypothetical protein NP233_g8522 [Leucocoprinus birnbaumii]|uniref:HAT C-terminal dimerisation domain-containing protein n=1 Tax=Leucocoprinus birnbaumii TaxID=56174 RepID=A0AAD5VNV1_9AGAR|nr:hypothetical protein NP233_g8522 [Leucocoprinus birnbaumii]